MPWNLERGTLHLRPVFRLAVILVVICGLWGACAGLPGDRDEQPLDGLVGVLVVRVIDGDAMVIKMPDRSEERLRLIGVDTPETSEPPEPFGPEATAYAVERLEGREVFLETDVEQRDRYGRLLGYLWLERPVLPLEGGDELRRKMFNAQLLVDGYALLMTVPPNVKYVDFFREFQQEARENARGLWGLAVDEEEYYVGNANTRRFHRPDCPGAAKIAPANLVRLKNRDAAFDARYEPCRTCNP